MSKNGKKIDKSVVRRLLTYTRPYRGYLIAAMASALISVLLTLTGGLVTLPLAGIVLYQAAWCVLALVFPLMQHYY